MGYYKGCKLIVEVPTKGNCDESAITKALIAEMPGIEVEIRPGTSLIPTVVEAFVPDNHGLAGAAERGFGSTKLEPTGGRTLLTMAEDVLRDLDA